MNILVFPAVVFTLAALRQPEPFADARTTRGFWLCTAAAATFWALVIG